MGDPPRETPIRAGAHDRFECRSCTSCCRSFTIAVGESEIARISAGEWPAPWVESDAASGLRVLRRREDGACVFLDADGLCLVQKRLGLEAKPDLCRMFPLALVRAPDGALDATVVPECTGWHESHASGAPLASGRDVPRPLPLRLVTIAPPALPLRQGGPLLLWEDVRALARRLGAIVTGAPSLDQGLASLGAEVAAAGASAGRRVVSRAAREEGPAAAPSLAERDALLERIAAALLAGAEAPGADAEGRERAQGLARACHALRTERGWDAALASLPSASQAFLRAVVRAWLEGPTLAQARVEVEAVLGLVSLCARVAAARAIALAPSGAPPPPAVVNGAAKEVSLLLRDRALASLVRAEAPALRALLAPPA